MTLLPSAGVAVIVQARMGSIRLPGKVLMPFGEKTMLAFILRRLRRGTVKEIWVATSELPEDDAVAVVADAEGAGITRGSDDDVLGRFRDCIEQMPHRPDLVVRVCADRPLICPSLLAQLLDLYPLYDSPDYLSNTLVKSYPDGLDLEIVRTETLLAAAAEATDADEREHVTPFIYRRPERFSLANVTCPFGNLADVRAVVDTQADYDSLVEVERRLGALRPDHDHLDLVNLATVSPELFP